MEEFKEDLELIEVTENDEAVKSTEKKKCSSCWQWVVSGVMFAGLVALYILHFTQSAAPASSKNIAVNKGEGAFSLLTVNNDSIIEHFDLAQILKNELEEEAARYQKELASKQSAFEERYRNFQINVQNNILTQTQVQNAEQQLMQEAEVLRALSDQYTQTLAMKEMSVQREITDSIINATRRVNEANYSADYVFATANGSAIIYGNEAYDITDEVIEELNNSYGKTAKK